MVTRLDPGVIPFRKATSYAVHVSGGEFNVAANLADAFGMRTAIATAMVDYPIGDLVARRVRSMGVTGHYRHFAHDGVTGPNIATVYSDRGLGMRAPVVFYNRANEAAARLAPGDFDWPALFGAGVRWFHSGGIFAALSADDAGADHRGDAGGDGGRRGRLVRPQLPRQAVAGARRRATRRTRSCGASSSTSTCCSATRRTSRRASASPGPEVRSADGLDPASFLGMMDRVVERYPRIRVVATTLREVRSASRHDWSAVAWVDGESHVAPTCELDVYDRVGGGDGFASGFIYGLLTGETPADAVQARLGARGAR